MLWLLLGDLCASAYATLGAPYTEKIISEDDTCHVPIWSNFMWGMQFLNAVHSSKVEKIWHGFERRIVERKSWRSRWSELRVNFFCLADVSVLWIPFLKLTYPWKKEENHRLTSAEKDGRVLWPSWKDKDEQQAEAQRVPGA